MLSGPFVGSATVTLMHPGMGTPPIENVTWSGPPKAVARLSPGSSVTVEVSAPARGCGLRRSSRAARRGPGARRRSGGRAGDRRRDLDGDVPNTALQQYRRLAELVVPLRVVVVLGRVPEGLGELVDQAFGRRPLANRLA